MKKYKIVPVLVLGVLTLSVILWSLADPQPETEKLDTEKYVQNFFP